MLHHPSYMWTWESQRCSGGKLWSASCRFAVWPWGHLGVGRRTAAPTEPGPVGRMVLSCRQDFQTLESSNSLYREGTLMFSRDYLARPITSKKGLNFFFAVTNIIGLPPNPAVDKMLTVLLLIKKLKYSFSHYSSSPFYHVHGPKALNNYSPHFLCLQYLCIS